MTTWWAVGAVPVAKAVYFDTMRTPVGAVRIERADGATTTVVDDLLVTEEPLEIRLGHGPLEDRHELQLSVTMRTPGNDMELALGFLMTEGVIVDREQVLRVAYCEDVAEEERGNVVRVELHPLHSVEPAKWQRNFYTSSSCGVCGKASIEAVRTVCSTDLGKRAALRNELISDLPVRMREAQTLFKHTGGIHAAALFNADGELLVLREDVGRHNAVDKVAGAMLNGGIGTDNTVLLVSGRAGFELVQKSVMMGIPAMAAVGAPSSLAVELARSHGQLLIGFLRGERFNIYSGSIA